MGLKHRGQALAQAQRGAERPQLFMVVVNGTRHLELLNEMVLNTRRR